MATQQKKRNKNASAKSSRRFIWVKQHPALAVLTAAAIILATWGAGYIVYRNHQVNQERAQFMAVKADLHDLAQQIAREVGQPTQSKEIQDCNYASQDYGLGPLSCSVRVDFLLPDKEEIVSKLNTLIEKRYSLKLHDNSANASYVTPANSRVYTYTVNGMYCGVSYAPTEDQKLNTDLSCDGAARETYFPVTDGSDYLP